jgi:hypothetical protein
MDNLFDLSGIEEPQPDIITPTTVFVPPAKQPIAAIPPRNYAALPPVEGAEFQRGDRVVIKGFHGMVVNIDKLVATVMGYGIPKHDLEPTYYYYVRTDGGHQEFGTNKYGVQIVREEGDPPPVVPDPICEGTAFDPKELHSTIGSLRRRVSTARTELSRKRTAHTREAAKKEVAGLELKLAQHVEVWDTWARTYPEAAAPFAPVVLVRPTAVVVAADDDVLIEVTQERDWTWVKFTNGKPPDYALSVMRNLGRWGHKRNAWYITHKMTEEEITKKIQEAKGG